MKLPPALKLVKDPSKNPKEVTVRLGKLTKPLTPESWEAGRKMIIAAAKQFGFMK